MTRQIARERACGHVRRETEGGEPGAGGNEAVQDPRGIFDHESLVALSFSSIVISRLEQGMSTISIFVDWIRILTKPNIPATSGNGPTTLLAHALMYGTDIIYLQDLGSNGAILDMLRDMWRSGVLHPPSPVLSPSSAPTFDIRDIRTFNAQYQAVLCSIKPGAVYVCIQATARFIRRC